MRPWRSTTSTVSVRAADRRVERARRRQQRGRRSAQLRDLDRALPQRAVERPVQMPPDEHVDADPDHHEREQDRQRRGDDRSEPAASGRSSSEHEADAAHGLDQRRIAELPAQVET